MLEDTDVYFECLAYKKMIRVWVVSEVRYDYDDDGYCRHCLNGNEYCVLGSPFDAYTHAKKLSRKYKKLYSDAVVIIKEILATDGVYSL